MAMSEQTMMQKWRAQPNDMIGGWCVTAPAEDTRTPAEGGTAIADFIDERYAKHIAALHNHWLDHNQFLAGQT